MNDQCLLACLRCARCARVFCLLAITAVAADIPTSAQLGAGFADLADRAMYRCADQKQNVTVCRMIQVGGLASEEGQPVRGFELHYIQLRLARICRVFDEPAFAQIEAAIARRRGAAEEHSELLKAGMGGAFANRVVAWREGGLVTMLEQYHEHVTTSSLCELDRATFDLLMSARAAQRVRGVRDL